MAESKQDAFSLAEKFINDFPVLEDESFFCFFFTYSDLG